MIGIDIGGTNIRCAVVDDAGQVIHELKEKSEIKKGPQYMMKKIIRMVQSMPNVDNIKTVGIGCPGPLDSRRGLILSPVNLPGWDNIPLREIISHATGKLVQIENDANVAALGEAVYGAGKGYDIVYYLTVSTGVGGGLVMNQRLISGAHNCAGEVANIIIQPEGVKHSFLNPGSLEGLASGESILRLAQAKGLSVTTTGEVFELYQAKHSIAIEVIDGATDSLARGLACISHIVDPDIFVLGGGVMAHHEMLLPLIKAKYQRYVYKAMEDTPIVVAELDEPGLVGAAILGDAC